MPPGFLKTWLVVGSILRHFGATLARLGLVLGPSGPILVSSLAVLGLSWACLEAVVATLLQHTQHASGVRLGSSSGPSWATLRLSGGCLGPSFSTHPTCLLRVLKLGSSLGPSWAILGPHWPILGPSWGLLGPFWGSLELRKQGVGFLGLRVGCIFYHAPSASRSISLGRADT